jgi:endonuclease/exonuclease/phosphatase family metal-dependent hydrolase
MKVATYNIMSGGFTDYNSSSSVPERLKDIQGAVKEINADVVGLVDTFRWKDVFTDQDIMSLFGYPYVFHIDMDDTRVDKRIGLACLSRLPVREFKVVRLYNRNAIRVGMSESGRLIDIFVVYFDDISEETRLKEAMALTTTVSDNVSTLVIGDLNAIAPCDRALVKEGAAEFLAAEEHKNLSATIQPYIEQMLRAEVLPAFERAGFQIPVEPTSPTAFTRIHSFNMPKAVFPVDHILAKGEMVHGKRPLTSGIFKYASDHYPVIADIMTE